MKNMLTLVILFMGIGLTAQSYFVDPVQGFSFKKESLLNMKNGDKIEGQIRNMKVKKGLVKEVVIKVNGEKMKIPAGDIKNMYVAQNSFAAAAVGIDGLFDLENMTNEDQFDGKESEYLKEGYSYYESHMTEYRKGKELDVLLLMVNPFFSGKIKVFMDPFAAETVSVGVGPMKAGGHAKSYFIKKGDDKVFRLKKKDFKDSADDLFDKCKKSMTDGEYKWTRFDKHVLQYTQDCN